jgi:5-methylcytosine-specific restriction endonuclease McrA
MQQFRIQNQKDLENQLIQLKALSITRPLDTIIQGHIKTYEDCLIKNYPDSEVLCKKKEATTMEPTKRGKKVATTTTTREPVKKKKKSISSTIKKLVWNVNIGEEIGKTKCVCCKSTDIIQMSFNCGHVIAEANGGETIVSNLKPICQNCNSSMGTKNMNEFMRSLN